MKTALVLENRISVEEAIEMFGLKSSDDCIVSYETIDGITNVYGISADPPEYDPQLVTVRWTRHYGLRSSEPIQMPLLVIDDWRSVDDEIALDRRM